MLIPKKIYFVLMLMLTALTGALNTGCIYKFADISIDPAIKTVKINFIENRAPYVNPQLSPTLTDRLKQKIVNQTRLSQTNGDNADYDVKGFVSDYSVSTTAVAGKTVVTNRLTVSVNITLTDQLKNKGSKDFVVSRNFEFSANQSLQAAQNALLDEMVRNLTDDIFNRLFSDW